MSVTRYPKIENILGKIEAIFKNNQINDWIDIDFAGWSSHPNERDKLGSIRHSIINKIIIGFNYINANGNKSNRFVEPEKLIFNTSTWYLMAYCLNRNEHRMFRLSRIKNVWLTDKTFEKRKMTQQENEALQRKTFAIVGHIQLHLFSYSA